MTTLSTHITTCIVTSCYVGKITKAPGTFGSLASFLWMSLLAYILRPLFSFFPHNEIFVFAIALFFLSIALFIVGTIASDRYMNIYNTKDPKEIVIDEVVGQSLTISFSLPFLTMLDEPFSLTILSLYTITAFILFRIFDVFKPWPISAFDQKLSDGFGVMADDIMAAFFASAILIVAIITVS